MNQSRFPFIQLSIAILVMSSSGTLGRYIDLPPSVIIWIRSVIAAIALYIYLRLTRATIFIGWGKNFRLLLLSSFFLAIHWITYFYALQLSTVAIGMLSLFTYPVMTTILEPIILKTPFDPKSIFLSLFALLGVYFLAPDLDFGNDHTLGVAVGLLSAIFYSLRNILLKKNITNHSGITLMYYQMVILALLLWPFIFIYPINFYQDVIIDNGKGLLILGIVTTAFAHTLFVKSFGDFSVSTVSIMSCMTPLFGAIIGYLVLDEIPTGNIFLAGSIILLTASFESVRSFRKSRVI